MRAEPATTNASRTSVLEALALIASAPGLAVCLFFLNAWIARDLFTAEFTVDIGSIESSFIAFAGYIMRNWGDLTWYPLWYGGMPFHNVYQPGFHVTVAAVGSIFRISPGHAYHLVAAIVYSFGPVTLFWLSYGWTGLRWTSFATACVYSLFSPAALLIHDIWADVGGPFHPRRFQALAEYGEGPHVAAVTLLPLVILSLYRATGERKHWWFPLASAAVAMVILTNWPGTIGLAIACAAFTLSQLGEKRLSWFRLLAIPLVAYLLACRWVPPSSMLLVCRNVQAAYPVHFVSRESALAVAAVAVIGCLLWAMLHCRISTFLRFGIFFSVLTAVPTLAHHWFRLDIIPQPARWQLEMEMAFAITGCYAAKLLLDRCPSALRSAALTLAAVAIIPLFVVNRNAAAPLSAHMDITNSAEYRIAQEIRLLRPDDRVFVGSNSTFWLNVWSDTPQVSGCCAQSVPDVEHLVSDYVVETGFSTGERDAAISLIWLKAYGATAISTSGPRSSVLYQALAKPFKFDGLLPVLWRDGDDVIYNVPGPARSLANVIPLDAIISRTPQNGLDTAPLEPYVQALDDPGMPPASFHWLSHHQARIDTFVKEGQVVALQISENPGWHARVEGKDRPIRRDKLGQMVIETGCRGACGIDLVYDGGPEARWTSMLQIAGILLAVGIPWKSITR